MKTRYVLSAVIGFCSTCVCVDAAEAFSTSNDGAKAAKKSHALEDFPVACEAVAAVEGREASLLPSGRKFKLVWNDEFDGDKLDETKWGYSGATVPTSGDEAHIGSPRRRTTQWR